MDVSTARRLWNRARSQVAAHYDVLTGKHFTYETDYFFGLDWMLAIGGVRLNSNNVRIRRAWNVYRAVTYFPILVIAWNLYLGIRKQADLDILLSCLQALVATVSLAVRAWIIIRCYEPLMDVRRYVNRRKFGRNQQRSLGIRSEAFYRVRKIMIAAIAFYIIIVASVLAVDLTNHHYLRLPFNFSENFPNLQFLCEKAFCSTLYGNGMRVILVYLIVYYILMGLKAEVRVIAEMVGDIFNSVGKRVQSEFESQPGTSSQQPRQDLMKTHRFWKYTEEEFADCIALIGEFFAIKNKARPFLNAIFLLVYYSNVLCLSSGAVYLTQMKTVTMFSLETLGYCLWLAIECASMTKSVSLLTEANESIAHGVYNLNWPEMLEWDARFQDEYRSVRTTMLNVMAVAQQALRLNCFGFFEFTQERFNELLKMAYSVFTFFRDFV